MSSPDNELSAVAAALYQGRKIEAIKLYRDHAGCGLKEAKEAVEELEASLRSATPEKFTAASSRAGCFSVIAISCGLAWTIVAASRMI